MITAVTKDEVDYAVTSTLEKRHERADDPFDLKLKDVRKLKGLSRKFIAKADRRTKKGYYGENGAASKQITDEVFYGYGYLDLITPPYNLNYLAKLYEISPAHHAACDAKVESVFGLGWEWIESPKLKRAREATRTTSGLDKLEKNLSSVRADMTEWLDNINNLDVFDEIMKKAGSDYETTGNGYIEVGRTQSGKIGYIGHIPSQHVRIRRERDGFVQIIGNRVAFFNNFGQKAVNDVTDDQSPNEIIHLKKYSPTSLYYGVPDIVAAKGPLAGNEFANRYNLDYFENKAVPRHVIVVKGGSLSQDSVNKLVEFFETGLRGQHHRSIYIPLGKSGIEGPDPDIEFKSIEADQQDFSFGDYREANNEEIFMAHRIPASRAGVFSANISLAASRDADKVFKESYSRPEQAIFEKKMGRIFKEITDVVVFKLNELSLVDEDTRSQIDERYLRAGAYVPDEVRRVKGMPPRPDGKGMEPSMLNPAQKAEATAQATASRTRDSARQASSSGKAGDTGTRNAKGAGRKTP
jgi:PBSX family phage portal protein